MEKHTTGKEDWMKYKDRKHAQRKYKQALLATVATMTLGVSTLGNTASAFAEVQEKQGESEDQQKVNNNNVPLSPKDFNSRGINNWTGAYSSELISAFNKWMFNPIFKPTLQNIIKKDGKGAAIAAVKGILSIGLTFLPPPFPLFGSVVDLFGNTSNQSTESSIWKAISGYVDETVDTAITKYQKYTLGAELSALTASLEEYQRVLRVYEQSKLTGNTKQREAAADGVLQQFRIANTDCLKYIARLQYIDSDETNMTTKEFKYLGLPFFAQAANIQLLLLRDGILNGKEWAMDPSQLDGYKVQQKELIKTYTEYVNATYKDGLKAEEEKPGTQVEKWNRVNAYKNTMTLSALDTVALFPLSDPAAYTQVPDVRQSRQLFSPIVGKPKSRSGSAYKEMDLKQLNEAIIPDTKYNGELQKIDMWTSGNTSIVGKRIDAMQPHYSNYSGDKIGGSQGTLTPITVNPQNPIIGVTQTHEKGASGVTTVTYLYKDGTKQKFGEFYQGGESNQNIYTTDSLGILSTAKAVGFTSYAPGYVFSGGQVFGFRNADIKDKHQLFTNMGVQIPAEVAKGGAVGNTISEIVNGQNAVLMDNTTPETTYTLLSPRKQQYKVKYRVAANTDSTISLKIPSQGYTNNTNIAKTTDTPETIKGEYGYYKLIDGPTITLEAGENTLTLDDSKGAFALDRIELEPVIKDERVAFDDFDNSRIPWFKYSNPEANFKIVDGGFTGRAGKFGPTGIAVTENLDKLMTPYTKYTMSIKLKLDSNDPNARQKVTLYTNQAGPGIVRKEVELIGGRAYQEFKLEFFTPGEIISKTIGIVGAGGSYDVLFDDVELKGIKNVNNSIKSTTEKWDSHKSYRKGDIVEHQGKTYECIKDYNGDGNADWISAPSLWKSISNQ
ncbi:insecticidal delta-endotoxin Cry8Ea1 family protein [Bacillus thuringiensis]